MGYLSISLNHLQFILLMFCSSQHISLSPWRGLFLVLVIKDYKCIIWRSIEQNTVIRGQLLRSIVVASGTHQHESSTDVHVSPPSSTPLPSPCLSHPSRLSQNTGSSSLFYTENSPVLSVLHMVTHISPCHSLKLLHSLLPPP